MSAPTWEADESACRAEVVWLHEVIARWFAGDSTDTAADRAAFADAQTPEFTLVTVDGEVVTHKQVLAAYDAVHGSSPGLRIRIEDVRLVAAAPQSLVATFAELHEGTPTARSRRCTVVFQRDSTAPHGLRWHHLQETAIAAS